MGAEQVWGAVVGIRFTGVGVKHSTDHRHEQRLLPRAAASSHPPLPPPAQNQTGSLSQAVIKGCVSAKAMSSLGGKPTNSSTCATEQMATL